MTLVVRSGELPYGLQQQDFARGAAAYDLGQELAGSAQRAINDYLGLESGARRGEANAISQAEAGVYENPLNRPREGTEAKLVLDWQTRYGRRCTRPPTASSTSATPTATRSSSLRPS